MRNLIRTILNEQTDNFIKIPAKEYVKLLDKYDNTPIFVYKKLTKNPEDKGKKLWIMGDLSLSNRDIEDLNGIDYIDGRLDISNTNILELPNITVKGNISDYGTPLAIKREKKIRQQKLRDIQDRREEQVWNLKDPNIDDEGILANAVFEYFTKENNVTVKTDEDIERLEELHSQMESLILKEKEYESDGKDLTDIHADIEATEEEINEINQRIDVYNFVPNGRHYNLYDFELISEDENDGDSFAAGTTDDADESLETYYEDWLDNLEEYLGEDSLRYHVDNDKVEEFAREYYEDVVRDSPEDWFDESDKQLSDEQEETLDNLRNELSDYEERLEMEPDDTPEYEMIQNHIDSLNSQIEEIESEKEISEEMIDEKIDDLVDDATSDAAGFLDDMGLPYINFIDKDEVLDSLVRDSDYRTLSGIDDSYDEVNILGETYIVVKTN